MVQAGDQIALGWVYLAPLGSQVLRMWSALKVTLYQAQSEADNS